MRLGTVFFLPSSGTLVHDCDPPRMLQQAHAALGYISLMAALIEAGVMVAGEIFLSCGGQDDFSFLAGAGAADQLAVGKRAQRGGVSLAQVLQGDPVVADEFQGSVLVQAKTYLDFRHQIRISFSWN